MKFEDKINEIISTLEEDIGTAAPMTMGNPVAANPAQIAPQGGQQPQQGEVTADQLMRFALNSDPEQLQTIGIDANAEADELFKTVYAAFSKGQGGNIPTGTTSAAPAAVNTAGVQAL